MSLVTEEKINRYIKEINEKIDATIFNNKGNAASFEFEFYDNGYMKYTKNTFFGKKSYHLEGVGIVVGNAIIASLLNGVSGQLILTKRMDGSDVRPEHGVVKILVEIASCYAKNRYDSLYEQNLKDIIRNIKQHEEVINQLAKYIRRVRDGLNKSNMARIYSNGIWVDEGDCQGNQGISFSKLGMQNLNTVECQYALAIALVDYLNEQLQEDNVIYYVEDDYLHGHRIYIRIKTINEQKSDLKSWY